MRESWRNVKVKKATRKSKLGIGLGEKLSRGNGEAVARKWRRYRAEMAKMMHGKGEKLSRGNGEAVARKNEGGAGIWREAEI